MANLSDFANVPSPRGAKGGKALPEAVVAFLTVCLGQKLRVTYAGLSRLVMAVREQTPAEGYMPGRHGSALAKKLSPELQPLVCGKDGTYSAKALESWADQGIEAPEGLAEWKVIPAESTVPAFESIQED